MKRHDGDATLSLKQGSLWLLVMGGRQHLGNFCSGHEKWLKSRVGPLKPARNIGPTACVQLSELGI